MSLSIGGKFRFGLELCDAKGFEGESGPAAAIGAIMTAPALLTPWAYGGTAGPRLWPDMARKLHAPHGTNP